MFKILLFLFALIVGGQGFCWKPGTSPFYGLPVVEREKGKEIVRVKWGSVFNDDDDCQNVDFLIMIQPRTNPSAYTLSDFTLKGQRSATLQLEDTNEDYVFQVRIFKNDFNHRMVSTLLLQVIAREDKGEVYGIDYKYSDMVNSYADESGTANTLARPSPTPRRRAQRPRRRTTTTQRPTTSTTTTTTTTTTTQTQVN